MSDWRPIAHHGQSVDEVRNALREVANEALQQFKAEMAAEGFPSAAIEYAAKVAERHAHDQIERDLPGYMRGMALTSGDAEPGAMVH
jgi:hypothetical protein